MSSQVCAKCQRANPPEASYCFYDGVLLAGHQGGGPIHAGSKPFPNQFVFPTGEVCQNFDQLALACQNQWKTAIELLQQGFLASFFGNLGRIDLSMAAKEAVNFPDRDRGLDQLLAKLPTDVLHAPKLKAEPQEITLGRIAPGTDQSFDLHLSNLGMRLLYGNVGSDSKWLTLGDAPGGPQKLFQFGSESNIRVNIRGQHLRAGTKPLLGNLVVESNGGNTTIAVRADVPITPYPEGSLLAGCITPRQIAEKARAKAAECAPLFESGAVANWYKSNGWNYPVQGPPAQGLGAVQQFFEALGLAKAPKVEISLQSLNLQGDPGMKLPIPVEVSTQEKKPVYAHATCDQGWIDCAKVKLAGRVATIQIVLTIPDEPGELLETKVVVHGNGQQKFTIPVKLQVSGVKRPKAAPPPEPVPAPVSAPTPSVASAPSPAPPSTASTPSTPAPAPTVAASSPALETIDDGDPFSGLQGDAAPAPAGTGEVSSLAGLDDKKDPSVVAASKPIVYGTLPKWVHLLPAVFLGVAIATVFGRDVVKSPQLLGNTGDDVDPRPRVVLHFDFNPKAKTKEGGFDNMSFGMTIPQQDAPPLKLFWADKGSTNNTMIQIDDTFRIFGKKGQGGWNGIPTHNGTMGNATFETVEKVVVNQFVKLIPGEWVQIADDNNVLTYKRFNDTALIRYKIENRAPHAQRIGLRVLLDTYIGSNDGAPFTIPGRPGLVKAHTEFNFPKDVPDFIQAVENEDLKDPGTVAQITFHVDDSLDQPSRVWLTRLPKNEGRDQWFPYREAKVPPKTKGVEKQEEKPADIGTDSATLIYWDPVEVKPGGYRQMAYTYGLGSLASGGRLALTVGGSRVPGGDLSLVASVKDPQKGETLTLTLPGNEVSLVGAQKLVQTVPAPAKDQTRGNVTWRLRGNTPGSYLLRVDSSVGGASQFYKLTIAKSSLF